jgi:hypothetical protein
MVIIYTAALLVPTTAPKKVKALSRGADKPEKVRTVVSLATSSIIVLHLLSESNSD